MGALKKPILNKVYNYLEANMSNVAEKKKTTLKPLADRVVAQRLESEETLKGGIIIPDSAKKKQEMAKVIAIGP